MENRKASTTVFNRDIYKEKVRDLHRQVLGDLSTRGFGDDDIDLSCHGGIEQETVVRDDQVIGWIVKVHLRCELGTLIYELDNSDSGKLSCRTER